MGCNTLWSAERLALRARDGNIYSLESLTVRSGERVALLGPSREFRRSVFRVCAGLEAPLEGRLSIDEESIPLRQDRHPWRDLLSKKLRRKIGVSLEKEGLLSNISVRECLETLFRFKYGDHNAGLVEGAQRVVLETSARVGLPLQALDKRPSELSLLEMRLASLCLAFLTKPTILLMENPSQGLNDEGWQALSHTLAQILESPQRTLILDTDDWLLARRHAQRWIVFAGDAVVFDGNADEYVAQSSATILEQLETERWHLRRRWIETLKQSRGVA
jgi:ABC-type transporter Mla maintaining outer membrane lipid asymmetry ATPase subunit MlaF